MKTLTIPLTGLGRDSFDHATGLRNLYEQFAFQATNGGHYCEMVHFDWHPDGDSSPDAVCRQILAAIRAAKADRVIILGHSFGAALELFFSQWLVRWHAGEVVVALGIMFDLAVNAAHYGVEQSISVCEAWDDDHARPYVPATSVEKLLAFFQRAGRPFGVCGCPVRLRDGVENIEVTGWTDERGTPVDHTSMISAPAVIAKCLEAMCGVFDNSSASGQGVRSLDILPAHLGEQHTPGPPFDGTRPAFAGNEDGALGHQSAGGA